MAIVFVVTLTNENLISCNQGDPRKRDQALHVNKDHFKVAVGLTEEKARTLYRKHFKDQFQFDIICSDIPQSRRMLLKEKFVRFSDKLIVHNNRANDWMHRQNFDHAMKVIDPYRQR